ncbi:MAG: sulfite exporter TauE/SafE family protein [Thermodesulfobacteriota bacterium]|nr:sulfite exporter TauE/SafE family protein [Thermodesulfobacteriota bacterium]
MDLGFILIIAFAAAMISTITGFGSATILTPFVAMVIDIKAAIVLVAFFHFANNLSKFTLMRKSINLRLFLVYGVPSVISALVGAWIFGSVDVSVIAILFSIFLVTFSIYSFFRPNLRIPEKDSVLAIGGLISGLTSGLIGVGGAIRSMFLISTFLKKEAYVATAAAIAIMVDVSRISMYVYRGAFQVSHAMWIIPLVIVAFMGVFTGRRFLHRLNEEVVRKAVLVALLLVGGMMFFDNI